MSKTLSEIAQELIDVNKKVQLIYAFNGVGKTRLSKEFKNLISRPNEDEELNNKRKFLYYNAFTEDLFYWDNDLENDNDIKLKIQPNSFTNWIFIDQGQDQNIISHFQRYTNNKLTPKFNSEFSEVTFSYEKGNNEIVENIKISKGEESNLIWCIFYSLMEQIIDILNVPEPDDRDINDFDDLEYIFIDDPVTSLDENHLIELAVDLAQLIRNSKSDIKFIITTHNPIFFNVVSNELNTSKYILERFEDNSYILNKINTDSPFSYHLFLIKKLKQAIEEDKIYKYHFNLLRNILEKTSTFLGYERWSELLDKIEGDKKAYEQRIINFSSHSKHSAEEIAEIKENDKRVLKFLVSQIIDKYNFK